VIAAVVLTVVIAAVAVVVITVCKVLVVARGLCVCMFVGFAFAVVFSVGTVIRIIDLVICRSGTNPSNHPTSPSGQFDGSSIVCFEGVAVVHDASDGWRLPV
jgi:hypothetical protein